jgi:outer membrane murein-binding lipoprotein Lpp
VLHAHLPSSPSHESNFRQPHTEEELLMKKLSQLGLVLFAVVGTMTLASCTSKITEEQLAQLKQLRDQERTLNSQISQAEQDRSRLQADVASRRAEVDRCNTNKQFVQGKLAAWPNVWPDWQDTPPPVNPPSTRHR